MCSPERFQRWQEGRRCLDFLDEELRVISQWQRCSSGLTRIRVPSPMPAEVCHTILAYLPVYHSDWVRSLACLVDLLQTSAADIHHVDDCEAVLARVATAEAALHDYKARFGLFAVFTASLGVRSGVVLPEREAVRGLLRDAAAGVRRATERWRFVRNWAAFNADVIDTPCAALRAGLRRLLRRVKEEVGAFSAQHPGDAVAARMCSEVAFVASRLSLIENLGDPAVTKRDCKNIFTSLNLPFDDGVSDDYSQSITFRQAVTLGLFNTTRLRGYIWQDRGALAEDPAENIRVLARKAAERRQREAAERASSEAAAARRLAEAARVLAAARAAVELRLAQRLWTPWESEVASSRHPWAGCELCTSARVVWVGVPLAAASPAPPVVLCAGCSEEYESKPVVHRSYVWLWIAHVVAGSFFAGGGGGGGEPSVPSVAHLARAQLAAPAAVQLPSAGGGPPHPRQLEAPPPSRFNDRLREEAAALDSEEEGLARRRRQQRTAEGGDAKAEGGGCYEGPVIGVGVLPAYKLHEQEVARKKAAAAAAAGSSSHVEAVRALKRDRPTGAAAAAAAAAPAVAGASAEAADAVATPATVAAAAGAAASVATLEAAAQLAVSGE